MMYESKDRQWFALGICGNLFPLGDCGDFDAADEIAVDALGDYFWLADADTAIQWMNTIKATMDRVEQ